MNDSPISEFFQYLNYAYFNKMKDQICENPIFQIKYLNIENRVNNRQPRSINGCKS